MNQLISLLDRALQANLSKRQWAAFSAVLRQTLGYHKAFDDLAPRRLEQLTGIRRNHIWQAKNELVAMGILCSEPGQYGELLGFPKTGQTVSQIRPEPVPKQDNTYRNLTDSNHYNHNGVVVEDAVEVADNAAVPDETAGVVVVESPEEALSYPPELKPDERQQAPRHLDGLSPAAAQQVLDVWGLKIRQGEVRKSRIGLLIALVKAQRQGSLNTEGLPAASPAAEPLSYAAGVLERDKPRLYERESWLEQQAQQGWLRDMAALGITLEGLSPPGTEQVVMQEDRR